MTQALTFASDFKLGHYMKSMQIGSFKSIPSLTFFLVAPRAMFWSQVRLQAYYSYLIDVEAKLGCSYYCRWNSAARRSSMDVHQYPVIQSLVYCYNTSDVYNSDMCSPTQKDGWVQVAIVIIYPWLIKTTDSFALAQKYSAPQVSS